MTKANKPHTSRHISVFENVMDRYQVSHFQTDTSVGANTAQKYTLAGRSSKPQSVQKVRREAEERQPETQVLPDLLSRANSAIIEAQNSHSGRQHKQFHQFA